MSLDSFLIHLCTIANRTTDSSSMRPTASWNSQPSQTRCRALFQTLTAVNPDKTARATSIRARFALPLSANIAMHDRIIYGGRNYDVIHVNTPSDLNGPRYKVAVCEVVAGAV